ncbi:two-component sensor histidine kinase [Rhodospirillum rubrum]|uniref:two-component system sensor histidine kinase NtrB n=1 Tax=Rhodospirillum rubrum TaxID=1085 RepID=UPI001908E4A8|nr:ATP-binding protein [Rhodospirillum rubrum]MBK1664751.1 two-component sensor histidine kinase [Rhodospirillum rubrum]MBK1676411.1 two-component sensor histidine kinase [Rhodospirillum rubrum]
MVKISALTRRVPVPSIDPATVLSAIASAVICVDEDDRVQFVNAAGEQMFESTWALLRGMALSDLIPPDCPIFGLMEKVRRNHSTFSEYGVQLDTPRTGQRTITVRVSPLAEYENWVVISLHELSMALKIGQQMSHRNAARSVTAMAALLAHEVKNPLSGIRGAAQLLEANLPEEDHQLVRLIIDETDRIVALVDRMEVFSDNMPLAREAVNIHRVLEHVRMVAENGFARGVRFVETYDPSLPAVLGSRDQLIQVFLNLIKNAAEAIGPGGGEIVLSTAYQQGLRLRVPGGEVTDLPLVISVRDNGTTGISEDLRGNLFDPFVTTKPKGSGLGLPLVAKIINDHGGIIEFDSVPGRTVFTVMLPMAR